ncbi:hypothetical protein QAD02_010726 [Eretmocerus hayati]|uniref:Uncharacterized protein n=1 Tax=Eretmocerus hayati TaxID=131215 RepID=A0ACC2NZH6_9HYME|nr:hypothetical protein QAD02_010726 [Eretmocerus hayati]
MHELHKLLCPYEFKNQKFYKSENFPFFTIVGKCSDTGCQNFIRGECSREFHLEGRTLTINIETFDIRGVVGHKERTRIAGPRRIELGKKMKYATATCHRNEIANELLEYSDVEPGFMETSLTARKIRQEAIDRALKLYGPRANFESLIFLKNNGFPEIRFVSQSPFFVIFYTDEQLEFLIELYKRGLLKVSIDASGGFARILEIFGFKTGHLFFYVMVGRYSGKIIPSWQMLSEAHDANTIKFALKQPYSVRAKLPKPEEVVCDGSLALLNGTSLAYNGRSYRTHLDKCYKYLIAIPSRTLPTSILALENLPALKRHLTLEKLPPVRSPHALKNLPTLQNLEPLRSLLALENLCLWI